MTAPEKTCILCKHYRLDEGSPGYSEWTPGEPMDMLCLKKHWEWDMDIGIVEFRRIMLTANECADYEYYDTEE